MWVLCSTVPRIIGWRMWLCYSTGPRVVREECGFAVVLTLCYGIMWLCYSAGPIIMEWKDVLSNLVVLVKALPFFIHF